MKKEILKSSLYLCYITFSVVKLFLLVPYLLIKANDEILKVLKNEIELSRIYGE